MAGGVDIKVDASTLVRLGRVLKAEEDGRELRKELIGNLRVAVAPGVTSVRGKVSSIPHHSAVQSSPSLGSYLSSRVRTQVRLSGNKAGVAVRVGKTPGLRGFANAARNLNKAAWNHRAWGKDVWVEQQSPIPGYFDQTLTEGKPRYRAAVIAALESMSARIAGR
jgi:hypothetical protein